MTMTYPGVNGLEAGQTFIVACATLGHNLLSIAGYAAASPAVRDGHLFSAYLMMPLAATMIGLLVHNWWVEGLGVLSLCVTATCSVRTL